MNVWAVGIRRVRDTKIFVRLKVAPDLISLLIRVLPIRPINHPGEFLADDQTVEWDHFESIHSVSSIFDIISLYQPETARLEPAGS